MRLIAIVAATVLFSLSLSVCAEDKKADSIYGFKMQDIDGKDVDLSKYKGKVVMVVNVASRCGLTPQYEALEKLYREKKDKGLVILGFPANEFNGQEPGTNAQIKEFCTGKYDVTFDMFSKIVVKGEGQHPLYQYLTGKETSKYPGDIEWNFAKFVISRDGQIVNRFSPRVKPDDKKLVEAVEAELAKGGK